jgi:hypothetical protein
MGPRTRSAASSPVKPTTSHPVDTPPIQAHEPRKLLLIPTGLSTDARILVLPHPRDYSKKRFLFCPSKGLFEFTRVAAPSTEHRSILLANNIHTDEPSDVEPNDCDNGYINKDAQLLVATPFDLFFLLLPLLPSSMTTSGKILFQPLDDLLESVTSEDKHLQYIVQHGRHIIERSLYHFCDAIDAGDEKMFRLNEEKTVGLIARKVQKVVQTGFPVSLEERFVTRALEAPVLSVKREESSVSAVVDAPIPSAEDAEDKSESFDSQSTTASTAPSMVFSEVSVASSVTTITSDPIPENIKHLQRLKTAQDFVLASYMPPTLSHILQEKVREAKCLADFNPLDQHIKRLAELRAAAGASRSIGDFSRKRGNADDDEAAEERAEKKRKQEEDEKRKKAGESRGVRELKKVNVSGMKRMSDFFSKKPATAKAKS